MVLPDTSIPWCTASAITSSLVHRFVPRAAELHLARASPRGWTGRFRCGLAAADTTRRGGLAAADTRRRNPSLYLKKQESIYSDTIEFFHDKAGLINSKSEIILGTKNNICGKVTRYIIPGSIEVYPIHNYGAVEIGFHRFYNNQEPDAASKPSKFIIVWKKEKENWTITKVVSLHWQQAHKEKDPLRKVSRLWGCVHQSVTDLKLSLK